MSFSTKRMAFVAAAAEHFASGAAEGPVEVDAVASLARTIAKGVRAAARAVRPPVCWLGLSGMPPAAPAASIRRSGIR